MALRLRWTIPAIVVLGALSTGIASSAPKPPFKVASTLDGKTVLPHRIHWLAMPRLPLTKIKRVDFLIDGGKPRWVEANPPYTYSDDEGGPHKGYLVTSWLTPGKHRFTVRAVTTDSRTSSHTVVARVLPAPELPAGLGGTWQRTITDTSGAPEPNSKGNPTETFTPAGTYTMVIEKRWIQVRWPGKFHRPESDSTGYGWILDSDYVAGPNTIQALGPVIFDTAHDQQETGWWCWEDGPEGDYTWSVSGDTLTLKPNAGADPCGVRGFIWGGDWKRVG